MEEKKRLYKSQEDRALFGVCGGIAAYFDVDSLIVRLLFVLFTIMYGVGILFYLIAALIIPNESAIRSRSNRFEYVDADGTVYQNRATMDEGQEPLSGEMNHVSAPQREGNQTRSSSKTIGVITLSLGLLILLRVFIPQIDIRVIVAGCLIVAGLWIIIRKD